MNTCEECGVEFKHACSLRRHMVEKHKAQQAPRNGSFRCPSCATVSPNNEDFEVHLLQEHHFAVKVESITFKTEAEFIQWKESVEASSPVKFVVRDSKRTSDKCTVYYRCNRDGVVRTRVNSNDRQRETKFQGSRKIDARCPARITAAKYPNGSVEVTFCSSHFGHKLEVAHVPIPSPVKKRLAAQIASKVPFEHVLIGVQKTLSGELKREHIVSSQDLRNIVRDFGLVSDSIRHADDATSVDAWVQNERALSGEDSSVILYKPKGSQSTQLEKLKDEDFILAIMTPAQREILMKYGSDVVCLDSTYGTNGYGYEMTTILVLDEVRQGFPCAFLFTNRNDRIGIETFLEHVKRSVGTVAARILMTDVAEVFYNSWKTVMGDCQHRLFCVWHVLCAWHNKINATINDPDKKKRASDVMDSLLYETDEQSFSQIFSPLVDSLCSDKDTRVFGCYIKQNYEKNCKNWAYCYRDNSGIDTNMSLERMHGDFKHVFLKGTCAKRLDLTLNALMRFINKTLFDRLALLEEGKVTHKIRELRKRHKVSLEMDLGRVQPSSDEGIWSVASAGGNLELYKISRVNSPCPTSPCNLVCRHCRCCVHSFVCTCIDSSVKYNLCKHIHLVCRYISQIDRGTVKEQYAALNDHSDAESEVPNLPALIIDKGKATHEISQLVGTLSRKRASSSSMRDCDLKKRIVDTFMSSLSNCQTREDLLNVKRIVDSIQPVIDASHTHITV